MMEHLESSPVSASQVKLETNRHPLLSRIMQFVKSGWPDHCDEDELKPFWYRRKELSV